MKKIILFVLAFGFLLTVWQVPAVQAGDDKELSAYKWGYWNKMVAPAAMKPEFPRPVVVVIPDPDPGPDPDPKPKPKIFPGPPVRVTPDVRDPGEIGVGDGPPTPPTPPQT